MQSHFYSSKKCKQSCSGEKNYTAIAQTRQLSGEQNFDSTLKLNLIVIVDISKFNFL